MLYRLAMIGIIAFWLVMMGLLVRLETHPGATDILDVPVSYVMRIMFKHGQQSVLMVRDEGKPVGTVSLHPSLTGSGGQLLDFSGALSVQLPLAARRRFNFNGSMDMDMALRVLDFHLDLTMQQPRYQLSLQGDMARKILTYEMRQGSQRTPPQTLPMDGPALLQALGIDANALPIVAGNISPPAVTARETQITLHGEQLDVFDVTVHEGTDAAVDFYVTQLGQIVQAKTNFGYTFSGEDFQ
jgi:hypothetical protein